MTVTPKYNLIPGTQITLLSRSMTVTGKSDHGYKVVGHDDGVANVVPFERLIEYLRLPGSKINVLETTTGDRLKNRLGGYCSSIALPNKEQQAVGEFHDAMCKAVDMFLAQKRQSVPNFQPSERKLNTTESREFIAEQAGNLLGKRVRLQPQRGGKPSDGFILYRGRTIIKYYKIYKDLEQGEDAADALVPLDHLRGNRTSRITFTIKHLMTEAWDKYGLDIKGLSIANVHRHLESLIEKENKKRLLNELPVLPIPSETTLRRHRAKLVTPTELLIATKGLRETKKSRGRGSTDVRSLMIAELCGMDEAKMSMVTSAKLSGFWHTLSDDAKAAYEAQDEYIRKRLHIIILYDVASRMPLAWIITENPNSEATLALLRMATRDKSREKARYGCMNEAASACGILLLRNDNGVGLRNGDVISALMGIGTFNEITRTYSPMDRASDERLFGTMESVFYKEMPGYTGRRPGEIPGYDAIKNGVVDVETLNGMLTRYLVDEYPFQRHYGVGMFGRRPWDVYQDINNTRGQVPQIDPNTRRIHLGWEVSATPSDEGLRVFGGIWFNSDQLQIIREEQHFKGKVQVFVDPDDLNLATVLMPGYREPIEVTLQTTVFADMTLGEVLQLVAEYRREDPAVTEIYHDRLMEVRARRYKDISSIGVEHDLPRSYTTIEECKALAKAAFAGARIVRTTQLPGTAPVDAITKLEPGEGVFPLGGAPVVIDKTSQHVRSATDVDQGFDEVVPVLAPENAAQQIPISPKRPAQTATKKRSMKFARPKNLKEFD